MTRAVDIIKKDYVSMRDLISDWEGTSDVTEQIQDALDTYDCVFFPRKPQGYKISDTLQITRVNQNLYGESERGYISDLPGSIVMDAGGADIMFSVRAPSVNFARLTLRHKGRLVANTVLIDADEEGWDSANTADVDITFTDCTLGDSRRVMTVRGRGLNVFNNSIVLFVEAIVIDWPSTFVEGPNPDQKVDTGMRVYRIDQNRFHGSSGNWLVQNVGDNAANIQGIHFCNNYIDTNSHILKGHANNSLIQNNLLMYGVSDTFPMFELTGGLNVSILGNQISGMKSTNQDRALFMGVRAENVDGLKIADNTFYRIDKDVVVLSSCDDVTVQDNKFIDCCLENDGGETSRSIVRINSNIDGLVVEGNTHRLTASPEAWTKTAFVNNTGGYAITNHRIKNNTFERTLWNTTNFTETNVAAAATTHSEVLRYDGNGDAERTFTFAFRPRAAIIFKLSGASSLLNSIMVVNNSTAGTTHADIDGHDVIVKGDFNTNLANYAIYAFM